MYIFGFIDVYVLCMIYTHQIQVLFPFWNNVSFQILFETGFCVINKS